MAATVQTSQQPPSQQDMASAGVVTGAPAVPGQRQPKLRLSCDACAAAKVKCSKEHPRCERCIAGGMTCVYGPSRKHGKPQHKKKQQPQQDTTKSLESSTRPPPLQQRDSSYHRPSLDAGGFNPDLTFDDLIKGIDSNGGMFDPTWPPLDTPSSWSSSGATMIPSGFMSDSPFSSTMDDMFAFDSMSSVPSSATSTASPPKPSFNHLFDPSGNSMDFSDFVVPEALPPPISKTSSASNLADIGTSSSASSTRMGFTYPSPTMGGVQYPSGGLPHQQQPTPPASRNNSSTHDCYALAYSTLATLHYRSQSSSSDVSMSGVGSNSPCMSPFPTPTDSSTSSSPSLENLLRNNKAAINNVLTLLQCSCAGDPHMAMLYASITSKILLWYQVAAGVRPSSTAPTPISPSEPFSGVRSGATTPSFGGCSKSPHHPSGISFEPVRIGSFSPDKEDQEPMRRVLLLGELRKAGQLIDALSGMHKDPCNVGDAADWGAGHIYAALGAWLKSELHRTMRDVRKNT